MAFVDFMDQGGSRFPLPAPPELVTAPAHSLHQPMLTQQPIGPPQAPLYQFRPPTFCPRCYTQFNANFVVGGMCPNCRFVPPQLALRSPSLPRPVVHPPVPPPPPKTRQDDHFLMTDMLHVIDDVLKEQEDTDHMTSSSSPVVTTPPLFSAESALHCQCGCKAIVFCTVRQIPVCRMCMTPPDSTPHLGGASPHSVYSTSAEPMPAFDEESLQMCAAHKSQKATLFCHNCLCTMCASCVQTDHPGHSVERVSEVYACYRPSMEQLLSKSQVEINLLEFSRAEAEKMRESVGEKQAEAVENVRQLFKEHRAVLEKREQEVIAQVNSIAELRVESLTKEVTLFQEHLSLLSTLSREAESALKDSNHGDILVSHFKLSHSLQKYRSVNRNPSEDDSFIIKPNPSVVEDGLKNLCLFTTAPHPPHCTVVGEGLHHPRVHRLCTVTLVTKDRSGVNCLEGGERLFVQLKSVANAGGTLSVDVRDNSDGSYSINFRPRMKGEHQLVIAIRGQHIQGSPFTLLVDGGREYGRFGLVSHVFGSEGSKNGQFCRPWGICCDHHGNLIVGDRSNHRVQVFDSNGVYKYQFGEEGSRPGQFNRPAGVAVTREGHIVVADKDNHRIQVLKSDGSFLFTFGSKGGNDGQMIYPYDVAVNQLDGRIAVTDTGNHRLLIFNHHGVLLGKFGYKGYLCGHFDSPRGIAFNDDGHIIVSDFNVHHILVIHPDGTTARILGSQGNGNGQFMRPQGIAVDHMGNYVVADTRNNRVVIMHPNGHFIAKFGTAGQGHAQFDRPTSIAVMPDGRIAVVDFGNSRVQIF